MVGRGVLEHAGAAEHREQLVEPAGVHAEPGRADRQAVQVPGAVEAVEDPGGAGVQPADDHGVRRVDAELQRAAVPPDAAERGLELRALWRHAEERDTVRRSQPSVSSTGSRAASWAGPGLGAASSRWVWQGHRTQQPVITLA